jgi:hypothetical protein
VGCQRAGPLPILHGSDDGRSPAGQILDFVDSIQPPDPAVSNRIITTLARLVSTRAVRDALGISTERGVVYSHFPADEVFKGLTAVVGDLRSRNIKVTDVYYETDRLAYILGGA